MTHSPESPIKLTFCRTASLSGELVYGYRNGWHWECNRGTYLSGKNFFWVHWEVHVQDPDHIQLHVESPKAGIDARLNSIKEELVALLTSADIRELVLPLGYEYKRGGKSDPSGIHKNRSTTVFSVNLDEHQRFSDHEEAIEHIDSALGARVDVCVQKVVPKLRVALYMS